jgi:EmrB/QacA subfamily drug resistance transporter
MAAEPLHGRRLALVLVGIGLALLLAALDQTIVGTALPRIVAELQGLDYYSWVLTAYLVASTTMTPIAGKLGDLFGRKPFLIGGMVGFVAASALCGQAQNMAELVAFRGIQGLFGGTLFATVFASLADIMTPRTRARMQGVFGGVFGIASVIGPTLGGFLTDNVGWRWVFYVNIPVGALAVTVVALTMPSVAHRASWRDIDFLGAALLAGGLVPLLVGFSITNQHDLTSPEVLTLLGVAVVILVAFFFVEQREEHPMVPFGLFRNRTFAVSVITGFLISIGMFGSIVFVPLLYQGVLGVAATNSGLLLTPMIFGLVVGSVITGQLIVRISRYRYIGTVGIAITAIGLLLLAQVGTNSSQSTVVRDLVMVGFGVGTTMPLYVNAVQSALPVANLGVATSQLQFWRNIGSTMGVSILGTVLSRRLPQHVTGEVLWLNLPPQTTASLPQGGNAQSLFDPAQIASIRVSLPPAAQETFELVMNAVRTALASTLHDLFIYSAIVAALAIIASVLLDDVPLRGHQGREEVQAFAA